jgi:hypothetical protein
VVFVEKGLSLLNKTGRLGFILPHKFFNAQYGEALRKLIADGRHLAEVVHFGDQQVFAEATTYTCLMFLDKSGVKECQFAKVADLTAWRSSRTADNGKIPAAKIRATEWNFAVGASAGLFEKLANMPTKLGNLASIFVGLQTSADKVYVLEEVAAQRNLIRARGSDGVEWEFERACLKPFLNDTTVSTFVPPTGRHWLIFPYMLESGKAILHSQREMTDSFPMTWKYLKKKEAVLRGRESGKADNETWYGYIYRKNLTIFEEPKLIVQVISKTGRYGYDSNGLYFTGGGNGPYYGVRWASPEDQHSIHYLQALLGSRLLDSHLQRISSPFRGGYYSYGKRFIEQLPIRPIDFSNPGDRAAHGRMVSLVERMLDLHKKLGSAKSPNEKTRLDREITATDDEIDRLVYELYGLTDDEIKRVDEATR